MTDIQTPQSQNIHEVEVTYTTEQLVEKLNQHDLLPAHAYSKVITDTAKLAALKQTFINNPHLSAACEFASRWRANGDASSFTANVNQFIFLWVNALEDSDNTEAIISIIKCFQIKRGIHRTKSSQLHLLLSDLVIETMQKYHAATLDYLFHYDENLLLPNASQIVPNLETVLSASDNTHITALFSLHFQTESNNFLLPKDVSIALNKRLMDIIQKNVSENAQLHFSGDSQFDVIIPEIQNSTQVELIRVKIFGAFEETIFIEKQSILLKPFIGCSYSLGSAPSSAQDLFENAKLALEHAITTKQYYVEYTQELEQYISKQIVLESKVLEAFDSNNLTLHFQPIVDIKKLKCVGAEVLLRWSDRYGQNIAPNITIEVLNNAGKGQLFTRWLINSTCRYAYELVVEKKLDLYLTLNLRAEDLYDTELPSLFANALSLWKLDPKYIVLEITENGILEQNETTHNVINALSNLGFKFALDDFGTGFSSLTRLRTLPIDLIKIDQSFVRDINNSKEDYEIVQSIAMLAESLGKEVLAEGVENEACLTLIDQLKIGKCQGYHFSKPIPYEDFIKWAEAH